MYTPQKWHIEPTSRCTLECPGCDRTWFKKTFKKSLIHDLDVDEIINFFLDNKFTNQHITLCGNNGDPIYHPKFIYLVQALKAIGSTLHIHTNGSAKTPKFWKELCSFLTVKDKITFAIDGLPSNNHVYRINSNWKQVEQAIKITSQSYVQTCWQYIVFKYNQDQIQEAQQLSKKLGIDEFKILKSHRWQDDSVQSYMPDATYVTKQSVGQDMQPDCIKEKEIYIDAEGFLYPCCYTAAQRTKRKTVFFKNRLHITDKNFAFLPCHTQFIENAQDYKTADQVCKTHCSKL